MQTTHAAAALTLAFSLMAGLACDENAPTETRAPVERPATPAGADDLNLAEGDISTLAIPLPVNQSVATTGSNPAFRINQTGTGPNGIFQITRAGSLQPALQSFTNGKGQAAVFRTTNGTNDAPTLQAQSNGANVAIFGLATGRGSAGVFHLNNNLSTEAALSVLTTGSGPAVVGINSRFGRGGSFESNGVALEARTSGDNPAAEFGVIAAAEINPYALYVYGNPAVSDRKAAQFAGNVHVQGTLTKMAGSFRIDHPLDPEHKYLSHSFVESPDMKNVYDGTVTLDASGRATVELPDYFEALNRDFRYQLTAIGAPGPDLYIAEGVQQNHFRIAGGRAYARVSWQVTGVRQDAYAEQHRIKVEEDKPPAEEKLVARR